MIKNTPNHNNFKNNLLIEFEVKAPTSWKEAKIF